MGRRHRCALRDDDGGVWIVTGVLLGALLYAGIVATAIAGFSAAVPLVVLPPVVLGMMAANNLLGRRGTGRERPAPPDEEAGAPR